MSAVWDHSSAEGIELLVLLAIADFASDDGSNAFPSIETLRKKTRVSARTVQRAIRTLEARGEIVVQLNAGMRGANVYKVVTRPRQVVTPETVETGPAPVRLSSVTESPRPVDTVTPVTPRGDKGVTRTVLTHPSTPQPPASGGPVAAHCKRHTKHRKGCDHCAEAERSRLAALVDRDKRRTGAVFDQIATAKANRAPRPKETAK